MGKSKVIESILPNGQSCKDERSKLYRKHRDSFQMGASSYKNKCRLPRIVICFLRYFVRLQRNMACNLVFNSMQSFQSPINLDTCREIFVVSH